MNEAAETLSSDEAAGLVKLATFSNVSEAELRAAVLKNNGVATTVFGTNIGTVYAGQGFAKIELFVQLHDLTRAREILEAGERDRIKAVEKTAAKPRPRKSHFLRWLGAAIGV